MTSCERCGFAPTLAGQLDVHHRDGDHENNTVENLETLCKNCHFGHHGPQDLVQDEETRHLLEDLIANGKRRLAAEDERLAASAALRTTVRRAHKGGVGPTGIAAVAGVSRQTVHNILNR